MHVRVICLATAFALAALASSCARLSEPSVSQLGSIVRLGVPGADNRGVSVASDGQRVAVAWAAVTESATNVYAAVSRDGGQTFGAPARVNDLDGDVRANGEQPPRIAVGRDIVVIWQSKLTGQSRVRIARSLDDGRSFQAATTVHQEPLTGARGWASIALDSGGRAHVAWLDGRNAAPKPAPDASASASGGHIHGGGSMRQDIFSTSIAGDDRREASVATDVCFCCKTGVATSGDSRVYVAWRHVYPVNLRDMAVARSTDGGATFSSAVRVSEDGWQIDACPEDGPAIVAGDAEALHIAWPTMTKDATPRKAVFYAASTDGGRTFAPRIRLSAADAGIAAHPQIARAGTKAAVVWDETSQSGRRVVLRLVGGDAPGAPVVVESGGSPTYPAVAATAGGLVVAWTASAPESSTIAIRRVF